MPDPDLVATPPPLPDRKPPNEFYKRLPILNPLSNPPPIPESYLVSPVDFAFPEPLADTLTRIPANTIAIPFLQFKFSIICFFNL